MVPSLICKLACGPPTTRRTISPYWLRASRSSATPVLSQAAATPRNEISACCHPSAAGLILTGGSGGNPLVAPWGSLIPTHAIGEHAPVYKGLTLPATSSGG